MAKEHSVEELVREVGDQLRSGTIPAKSQIASIFERIDASRRADLETLARHGWYPDPRWLDGFEAAAAGLLRNQPERGNAELCAVVNARLHELEASLVAEFPDRSRFLAAAFKAHRAGDYALSIPLLLSQSDGVCADLFSVQLHGRKQKAGTMKLVEKLGAPTDLGNLYLAPLLTAYPIAWNEAERRNSNSGVLNRHAILHGESLDYDTHVNSCRAISHLRYVTWILVQAHWYRSAR